MCIFHAGHIIIYSNDPLTDEELHELDCLKTIAVINKDVYEAMKFDPPNYIRRILASIKVKRKLNSNPDPVRDLEFEKLQESYKK